MRRTKAMMALYFLVGTALGGCVSQARHDDVLAALADAEADVVTLTGVIADAEAQREALESRVAQDAALLDERTGQIASAESALQDTRTLYAACHDDHLAVLAQLETLSSMQSDSDEERDLLRARVEELSRLEAELRQREQVYEDLRQRLRGALAAGGLELTYRNGRMVLTVSQDLLFAPGEAELTEAGLQAMSTIASALSGVEGRSFQVQGHTDNVPIATRQFPSNWELSSARALVVMHALIAGGVPPSSLSAAGYGEFLPVADNGDIDGRAQNRRVEIVLETDLSSLVSR